MTTDDRYLVSLTFENYANPFFEAILGSNLRLCQANIFRWYEFRVVETSTPGTKAEEGQRRWARFELP